MSDPFRPPSSDLPEEISVFAFFAKVMGINPLELLASVVLVALLFLFQAYPVIRAQQERAQRVEEWRAEADRIESHLDQALEELRAFEDHMEHRHEAQLDGQDGRDGWPEGSR